MDSGYQRLLKWLIQSRSLVSQPGDCLGGRVHIQIGFIVEVDGWVCTRNVDLHIRYHIKALQGAVRMILTKVDAFVSGIGKILAHAFDLIGDAGKCPGLIDSFCL